MPDGKKKQNHLMDERTATVFVHLIQTLGRVAVFAVVSGFAYLGIKELAGKETQALISASLQHTTGLNKWLLFLTAISVLYAYGERKFREYKIRYLTQRITQLEKGMDPGRTSSGLTRTGNTHPKDK